MFRTGRTIRSARMNAITPPKLMPPFQRTAASGMFPTEQTNEMTATSGPTIGPHMVASHGRSVRKKDCQNSWGTQTASAPAVPNRTPVGHRHVHLRVSLHTTNKAPLGLLLGLVNKLWGEEKAEQACKQKYHDRRTDELGHRQLPSQQHKHDDAQL